MEIDENGHKDRNEEHESQIQKEIETELGSKFIRINPDKENFNIFKAQNKIFRHIKKSDKESTKKSLMDDAEKLAKMVKQLCV